MIHFASPWWLLLLILAEGMAAGFVIVAARRRRAARLFGGPRAAQGAGGAYWLRATLVVGAATLAVLAAARPQWGSKEFSRQEQGIDLVVALDVSQSMTATDVSPSRLGLAQNEIARLLDSLPGNRVGLVLFAGSAVLRSPLSEDTRSVAEIVRRADKEPGLTRAGSDIGAALDQSARVLDASETAGKAVLVVSDGEDFGNSAAAKAAELVDRGIVVFTAGTGTAAGSTLQDRDPATGRTRVKLDGSGQPVISRLDEAGLQALALAGKGRYLPLTGEGSLDSLRDDLAGLQQTPLSERTGRVPVERLQIFAAAALATLLLAWLVPGSLALPRPRIWRRRPRRLRPQVAMLLLALLFAGACAGNGDSARERNAEGNRLYAAGDYQAALDSYQKLLAERPDLPEVAYNTGNTLDRLGQYARAVEATRRALPSNSAGLGAATFYSLGNHYLALDQLPEAYDAYKNALLLDPSDSDAKFNLELVLLRLQQEQQQPAGQDQPGQTQDGQSQEGGQNPAGTPTGQAQSPGDGNGQSQQQGQQPGQPGTQTPSSAADIQRQLQDALAGIGDNLTFEQAQQILDLLNQLHQQQTRPRGGSSGSQDY